MILDRQQFLPLALPMMPIAMLKLHATTCSVCAIPFDIPGDNLSDDWGGMCRYCVTKAIDDELDLTNEVRQCKMRLSGSKDAAEAALILKHEQEYEDVHNGSGRSEEMPSELKARHTQEWKQFERQHPGEC